MTTWTDERVELLTKLNDEGHSSRYIAEQLGVTRNAVIGKLHRLGRSVKRPEAATSPTPQAATEPGPLEQEENEERERQARALEEIAEELPDLEDEADFDTSEVNSVREIAAETEKKSLRLSLMELTERTCKWPVGDPATKDFWFCGLPSKPGTPYCEAHNNVALQPLSSRRDPRAKRKFPFPRTNIR